MTTRAALDALIEELTVDAYDDEEQLSGFLVGAQEALVPGEPGTIVGVDVNVVTVDCGPWSIGRAVRDPVLRARPTQGLNAGLISGCIGRPGWERGRNRSRPHGSMRRRQETTAVGQVPRRQPPLAAPTVSALDVTQQECGMVRAQTHANRDVVAIETPSVQANRTALGRSGVEQTRRAASNRVENLS
jgi:hypothetical protein